LGTKLRKSFVITKTFTQKS